MTVKEVKVLNDRIEAIQKKRERAEAQREMLMNSITEAIEKYEKAFGVNLLSEDFNETKRRVKEEGLKVSKSIEAEYNLKLKVVSLLEKGDIAEANKLLGYSAEKPEPVKEVPKEDVVEVPHGVILEDPDGVVSEGTVNTEDLDEIIYDDDSEERTAVGMSFEGNTPKIISSDSNDDSFDDYDFDLDEDYSEGISSEGISDDISDDIEDFGDYDDSSNNIDVGSDVFEDFEEVDDDDDFGFGDMLSGTKFGD